MEYDADSSFELIRRAQNGDEAAVERLLIRYRPRLYRWATGRLPRYARESTDTEDLVQDVLLRTVQNFDTFEHRGEWALQAYLRQALSNRIRDELRRVGARPRRVDLPDTIHSEDASPLEAAIGRELFVRYEAALVTLGEIDREAVIARLELGCSYQEIALLIDKPSPDAARMTVARALRHVAEYMSHV
jgi:RNA polymerase sigma factor (sigma-70 family)